MKKILFILSLLLVLVSANAQKAGNGWVVGVKESSIGMWVNSECVPVLRINEVSVKIDSIEYKVLYSKKSFLRREHNLIMVDNANSGVRASLMIRNMGNNEYYVILRDDRAGFQSARLNRL